MAWRGGWLAAAMVAGLATASLADEIEDQRRLSIHAGLPDLKAGNLDKVVQRLCRKVARGVAEGCKGPGRLSFAEMEQLLGRRAAALTLRDALGHSLVRLGERDERVLVVNADLRNSVKTTYFMERFPERTVEVGIAEQNMIGVAAGLAMAGHLPFAVTFARFAISSSRVAA